MTGQPVTLLIVEDDEIDLMGVHRALRDLKISNPTIHAVDGIEALEILRGENGHDAIKRPYIILLDLNMPRMDGFEFLEAVRNDPALHRAVIFVLSTSDTPNDIAAAYDKNIAGYIVKDDLGDSFEAALNMIDTFARVVELPTGATVGRTRFD